MKIAILGATSQISQDLILSFSKNKSYNFSLFDRNFGLLNDLVGRAYMIVWHPNLSKTYAHF